MKKIKYILIITMILLLLVGCSKAKPEDVVKTFLNYAQEFDLEGMNTTIKDTSKIGELIKDDGEGDYLKYFQDILKFNAAKMTYEITDSKINGDEATVMVKCKYVDSEDLLKITLSDVSKEMFSNALTGAELPKEQSAVIFNETLKQNSKNIEEKFKEDSFSINCIKIEGNWYIKNIDENVLNAIFSNSITLAEEFSQTMANGEIITSEKENQPVAETMVTEPIKEYADIQNHWGKANIEFLIAKGGINGYPDGTFHPDGTITNAEFLKIAYLSATGEAMPEAKAGEHWATALFHKAEEKGIVTSGEMPSTALSILITRYQMARIMVRLAENVLNEEAANITGIENVMADYSTVSSKSYYKYYVEQAYIKGLLTGMDDIGTFAGSKTGTRAEACTMIARLLDTTKRAAVN